MRGIIFGNISWFMDKFAVIKISGYQYLVKSGSTISIFGASPKEVAVLAYWEEGKDPEFGTPFLENFTVNYTILESVKSEKIVVRRFKSKSRYKKNKGHRQVISNLKIVDIAKNGA